MSIVYIDEVCIAKNKATADAVRLLENNEIRMASKILVEHGKLDIRGFKSDGPRRFCEDCVASGYLKHAKTSGAYDGTYELIGVP